MIGPAAPGTRARQRIADRAEFGLGGLRTPVVGADHGPVVVRRRFDAALFEVRKAVDHVVRTSVQNEDRETTERHSVRAGRLEPADRLSGHVEQRAQCRECATEPWTQRQNRALGEELFGHRADRYDVVVRREARAFRNHTVAGA
ncbi:hypothetical protein BST65_15365 [Bradyrhizobium canariense]|nr:hypothetical protein BST65_15365 [Bradyrhizobium canariense]OSI38019.1 hypothetical protein BST66_02800 [Bradyrhizobium canariense]OSI53553.1 hypothetical protein BSZ20_03000 [Bradyrhizobium canariense]OSI56826.1 hypothetical protein BST67_02800 [Bradyrhizobium canariense]OSI59599.1 hypothetical protein BSZ15_03970 [Bradyrhizobium canariense]